MRSYLSFYRRCLADPAGLLLWVVAVGGTYNFCVHLGNSPWFGVFLLGVLYPSMCYLELRSRGRNEDSRL